MTPHPQPRPADLPGVKPAIEIEPLWRIKDVYTFLNCSRRSVERIKSSGELPKPDRIVGKRSPRWKPETIRAWVERGGRS